MVQEDMQPAVETLGWLRMVEHGSGTAGGQTEDRGDQENRRGVLKFIQSQHGKTAQHGDVSSGSLKRLRLFDHLVALFLYCCFGGC